MSNKNIINIINRYFSPSPEYRAAYALWLKNITSEELNKATNISDPIRCKVFNELRTLEKNGI